MAQFSHCVTCCCLIQGIWGKKYPSWIRSRVVGREYDTAGSGLIRVDFLGRRKYTAICPDASADHISGNGCVGRGCSIYNEGSSHHRALPWPSANRCGYMCKKNIFCTNPPSRGLPAKITLYALTKNRLKERLLDQVLAPRPSTSCPQNFHEMQRFLAERLVYCIESKHDK